MSEIGDKDLWRKELGKRSLYVNWCNGFMIGFSYVDWKFSTSERIRIISLSLGVIYIGMSHIYESGLRP